MGTLSVLDLDKFRAVDDIECHCSAVPGSSYGYLSQVNRGVDESIKALFLLADFKYDLWSIPLRGNIGAREARTEATSFALVNANGAPQSAVITNRYRDFLPCSTSRPPCRTR